MVVENFKPGIIARLGFDYETVRRWCPSIVYCSISGYGQEGPCRSMAAFDGAIQAASGMMAANGHEATGPTRTVSPIIDATTGMMAAFAIASALHRRQRTGEGQLLDVAMLDSAVCLLNPVYNNHLATGAEPELLGNQSLTKMPTANVFPTADGHVQITALTLAQVDRLLATLGCPGLREESGWATEADLIANHEAMGEALRARLRGETTAVWLERLEAARVPAAPIRSFREVMADPQLESRRLTAALPAPEMLERAEVASVTTGYVANPRRRASAHVRPAARRAHPGDSCRARFPGCANRRAARDRRRAQPVPRRAAGAGRPPPAASVPPPSSAAAG